MKNPESFRHPINSAVACFSLRNIAKLYSRNSISQFQFHDKYEGQFEDIIVRPEHRSNADRKYVNLYKMHHESIARNLEGSKLARVQQF